MNALEYLNNYIEKYNSTVPSHRRMETFVTVEINEGILNRYLRIVIRNIDQGFITFSGGAGYLDGNSDSMSAAYDEAVDIILYRIIVDSFDTNHEIHNNIITTNEDITAEVDPNNDSFEQPETAFEQSAEPGPFSNKSLKNRYSSFTKEKLEEAIKDVFYKSPSDYKLPYMSPENMKVFDEAIKEEVKKNYKVGLDKDLSSLSMGFTAGVDPFTTIDYADFSTGITYGKR